MIERMLTTVYLRNLEPTVEAIITEGHDVLTLRNDEGHDFTSKLPIPAAISSATFEKQFTLTYALIYYSVYRD